MPSGAPAVLPDSSRALIQGLSAATRPTIYVGLRGDTRELFVHKEFAPGESLEQHFKAENRLDALMKMNQERERLSFPVARWLICLMLTGGDADLNQVFAKDAKPRLLSFENGRPVEALYLSRGSIVPGRRYALVLRECRDEGALDKRMGMDR